jgi:hypothetical protein
MRYACGVSNSILHGTGGARIFLQALVAAAIPAAGYLLAYCFEFAYLHYFDISYRVIERLTIPTIIFSAVAVSCALLAVEVVSAPFKEVVLFFDKSDPLQRFYGECVRVALILAGPFAAGGFIFGWSALGDVMLVGDYVIMLVMMIALLLVPWFTEYRVGAESFRQGLDRMYIARDAAVTVWPYVEKIRDGALLVAILLVVAACAGTMFAKSQNGMYVLYDKGQVKTVLIQKVGDTLYLRDYDMAKHIFISGFYIETAGSSLHFQERISIKQAQ